MHLLERQNCKVMFKNMTVLSEESELQGLFLNKSSVVACDIKKMKNKQTKKNKWKKLKFKPVLARFIKSFHVWAEAPCHT